MYLLCMFVNYPLRTLMWPHVQQVLLNFASVRQTLAYLEEQVENVFTFMGQILKYHTKCG